MRENIVIGDCHSCRDEFNLLLEKILYDKNKHRLILVGDILDRGPDPIGLLHQIQDMGIEITRGNHENKALRWRQYEAIRELTGKKNPMKEPQATRRLEWQALTKTDLQWISNLPLKIHVKDNWYVVHAGMEPLISPDKQEDDCLLHIRYVDKTTLKFVKPRNKEQLSGTDFWAKRWDQPYNIVFGHHRFDNPIVFKNNNNVCIGIDTSCVYGNALTAYNIDRNEFIQVKANKTYFK